MRRVHIHVRDPQTERPSMDVALYRDVVINTPRNVRLVAKAVDLICQMGGRIASTHQAREMLNLQKV